MISETKTKEIKTCVVSTVIMKRGGTSIVLSIEGANPCLYLLLIAERDHGGEGIVNVVWVSVWVCLV